MSSALRMLPLAAALLCGVAGCSLFFGEDEAPPPPPWAITLQAGDTTNEVPRQEWLMIEGELLDSDRFQRFVETAERGSTWVAPVGSRTYRWIIHDYNPIARRVVIKRHLGE